MNDILSGLIFVVGVSATDIRAISEDFADAYWDRGSGVELNLHTHKSDPDRHLVSLESPTEFYVFQFLVNYITYPMHKKYQLRPAGYWQAGPTDIPVEGSAGKMTMLFIPESDTEHDNVYAVTEDGIAMILGFAVGYEYQPLPAGAYDFVEAHVEFEDYREPIKIQSISPFLRRAR